MGAAPGVAAPPVIDDQIRAFETLLAALPERQSMRAAESQARVGLVACRAESTSDDVDDLSLRDPSGSEWIRVELS